MSGGGTDNKDKKNKKNIKQNDAQTAIKKGDGYFYNTIELDFFFNVQLYCANVALRVYCYKYT